MARKRRAPNYTGALAQPIYLEDHYKFTGGLGQATQEPDVAAMSKRAVEKFWLLFKHYKIDPNNEQSWQELAENLALAHVPGLQFANRPKRGRKRKTGLYDELVREIQEVKSKTGMRTQDAIRRLRKDKPEKWGRERYSVESLGARYREARRRQKALASLHEAWLNEIATAISSCGPSATPPPHGGTKRTVGPTKISVRAKTSRRK